MNNTIGFIVAMGLQLVFIVLYIAMVLSIKYLASRSLPAIRRFLDQLKDFAHRTRHFDSTSHHPG